MRVSSRLWAHSQNCCEYPPTRNPSGLLGSPACAAGSSLTTSTSKASSAWTTPKAAVGWAGISTPLWSPPPMVSHARASQPRFTGRPPDVAELGGVLSAHPHTRPPVPQSRPSTSPLGHTQRGPARSALRAGRADAQQCLFPESITLVGCDSRTPATITLARRRTARAARSAAPVGRCPISTSPPCSAKRVPRTMLCELSPGCALARGWRSRCARRIAWGTPSPTPEQEHHEPDQDRSEADQRPAPTRQPAAPGLILRGGRGRRQLHRGRPVRDRGGGLGAEAVVVSSRCPSSKVR